MRVLKGGRAVLTLTQRSYSMEDLRAGALLLGNRARVLLKRRAGRYRVFLTARQGVRTLAGEFLNEALSHRYRQRVIRFNREFSQALLAQRRARAFPPPGPDPLEEMEPQVRIDREAETAELLSRARGMGAQ